MELNQYKTCDNANQGVWAEAILYGKKAGFEVCVLGNDSDAVQEYNKELSAKARTAAAKARDLGEDEDEARREVMDSSEIDFVMARVTGIRSNSEADPLTYEGKPVSVDDKAGLKKMLNDIPELRSFIIAFSGRRSNFLPVTNGGSNPPSAASTGSTSGAAENTRSAKS
jgi:hypothetical protein